MVHESGATQAAHENAHEIANVLSRSTTFAEDHDVTVDRNDGSVTISMWPSDSEVVIVAHVNADGVMTNLKSFELGGDYETEDLRDSGLWEDIVDEGVPVL